jgi:hypothetical protein
MPPIALERTARKEQRAQVPMKRPRGWHNGAASASGGMTRVTPWAGHEA